MVRGSPVDHSAWKNTKSSLDVLAKFYIAAHSGLLVLVCIVAEDERSPAPSFAHSLKTYDYAANPVPYNVA